MANGERSFLSRRIVIEYNGHYFDGVRETFGNISNPLEFRRRVQGEAAKDLPVRDALPQ